MKDSLLNLIDINKFFGNNHVLKNISLDIKEGEFLTILGPSGCGKTTLLRCIAGLERMDSGDILLKGSSIKDLQPDKRSVNMVFQNYALFPHLNIYDNIAYGPRIKKSMGEAELKAKIMEILELVQMTGYENRPVNSVSGGQKQRVALARALINEPDILLLDEPLGALDLTLRKHMQKELLDIQRKTNTTFVYITHDQEEALNMSDTIVVMDEGVIKQQGSAIDVYNNPKNYFVASFIGDRNILKVKLLEKGHECFKIKLGNSIIDIRCSNNADCTGQPGDEVMLAILMDKMRISHNEIPNAFSGEVISNRHAGSQIRTEVDVNGHIITVIEYQSQGCDCTYNVGNNIYITWDSSGAVLLPLENTADFEGND